MAFPVDFNLIDFWHLILGRCGSKSTNFSKLNTSWDTPELHVYSTGQKKRLN